MNSGKRVLAAITATLLCTAGFADDSPYMFEIPVERVAGDNAPLDGAVSAMIDVPDATHIGKSRRVAAVFAANQTMQSPPDPRHKIASFVVDYDEPEVQQLLLQLRATYGDKPTTSELTDFVFAHIEDKNYLRDFDLASRVAATGAGDCTEHAVLLTALARATGHSARIAVGVLLLEYEDDIGAYGHAWTEIYEGDSWQLADATKPQSEDIVIHPRYLPMITLDDEGPGYTLDFMRLQRLQPSKVSQIANVSH
ncbi:MAG: transglutaminase-like domain-containing protein [Woeseiaceae bacterium]